MNERDKVYQLLYKFENGGLISRNLDEVFDCLSEHIIGIGIGEQGFVTSSLDVRKVFEEGLKTEDHSVYSLDFGRVEISVMEEKFAVVCAEVIVNSHISGEEKTIHSQFQQSLSVIKERGEWKICGLHATTPIVTEDTIDAFPLKFAEKTLNSLREKIGEEAYLAEEQYRKAILADTIAFYIVNFTKDIFEKCQCQEEWCAYVEPGTPYEIMIKNHSREFVHDEDIDLFIDSLSLKNIKKAFEQESNEVYCEYRMKCEDGAYIWAKSIFRLITDVVTGDKKGILYVKNIDNDKRKTQQILEQADLDGMTKVYNKAAFIRMVELGMKQNPAAESMFLMIDVDDFKTINDTLGHPVGDRVLIAVAEQLQSMFGITAKVGRLGGDEFGIYLTEIQLNDKLNKNINMLLEKISHLDLPEMQKMKISVSIGGTCRNAKDFDELYKAADEALYEAKNKGKNRVAYH